LVLEDETAVSVEMVERVAMRVVILVVVVFLARRFRQCLFRL
jgi:hypothetical protein